MKAEKRLLVIGNAIWTGGTVVLVKIRDEVVVLIPAGKYGYVARSEAAALPVRKAILIVVIVDKLEVAEVRPIVHHAVLVDHVQPGSIVGTHAKRL